MKTLIIGTLIVILISGTVLADTGDDMRAAIQLQEQSFALGQMAQAERMRNTYVPYGYSTYYYPGYPGPYVTYNSPPPAVTFYPYPTERTVVIPVPSANEVSSPSDINYSTYTQRTTGTGD